MRRLVWIVVQPPVSTIDALEGGDFVLLRDWLWCRLEALLVLASAPVWIFTTRRAAARAAASWPVRCRPGVVCVPKART